mmetsp:Transcript_19251/g.54600  ORF Transcript_19251/g.54600 Transcript_19251/m.54600 type:complete len:408 (-) Transcript_19251:259-1482(-)
MHACTHDNVLPLSDGATTSSLLGTDLGVRVEEAARHAHRNERPRFLTDHVVEEDVSQERDRDLVHRPHDGIRRWSCRGHAVQGGEIEEEADQPGEQIFGCVIERVQVGSSEEYRCFAAEGRGREEETDAEEVVQEHHAELRYLHVLRREFHVQHVGRRRQAVARHPHDAGPTHGHVVPCGSDRARKHDRECQDDQRLDLCLEEDIIAAECDDVGDVFENGDDRHRVVFQTRHAGEEHQAKEDIDRRPLLHELPCYWRVFHPFHLLASLHGNDRDDCLEDDQQQIQVSVNQVVVTRCQALVREHHRYAAEAVHQTRSRWLVDHRRYAASGFLARTLVVAWLIAIHIHLLVLSIHGGGDGEIVASVVVADIRIGLERLQFHILQGLPIQNLPFRQRCVARAHFDWNRGA